MGVRVCHCRSSWPRWHGLVKDVWIDIIPRYERLSWSIDPEREAGGVGRQAFINTSEIPFLSVFYFTVLVFKKKNRAAQRTFVLKNIFFKENLIFFVDIEEGSAAEQSLHCPSWPKMCSAHLPFLSVRLSCASVAQATQLR